MKIIKINPHIPNIKSIDQAVKTLKNGGILMYPTDTCYGLGADMSNKSAFTKIYQIKKRNKSKPVSVIVPSIEYISNIAIVEKKHKILLNKYLPGPVTLILLSLDENLFPFSSIGIRIPSYKTTELISKKFNYPYITTSANIASYPPAFEIKDFLDQLGKDDLRPDLILDAGKLSKNNLSTVVDITSGKPKILRQGIQKIKT